jgi:uncharacterized protein YutE (UPF0331/DUF86 family)
MDESLRKLRGFSNLSKEEFLENDEKIDATKYNFIVAIESLIDICNRIISMKNLGYPQDYADVIKVLGQNAGFGKAFVKRLVEMVKFRNMLVHLYWKIENDRLYGYLKKNLDDFERFKQTIIGFLRKTS